ncbi:MAG: glutathione S-transferase family protein [Parvularculaceae bacterium]|nr:glutathione S-transferase family protein [Parvularculaceae bacterium]
MTIRIYGMPLSPNVRKPLAVAAHLGIAVELTPCRPDDPALRDVNPMGRIPAMDDDGFTLGESNAILLHLAAKKANSLYPDDQRARSEIHQFLLWDVAHWTPSYQPIQFERMVKGLLNMGPPDETVVAATLEKFAREAGYLNARLKDRDFLVGKGPTLADFAVAAGLTHARAIDLPLKDHPNVEAWNRRVMDLDGFRKTAG